MPFLRLVMRISNTSLQSFKELYLSKYGVLLSDKDAMEIAGRCLRLIEVVESNLYVSNQNAKDGISRPIPN